MAEHNQLFDSRQQWIDMGQSWLTRHPQWGDYFKAICFDAKGRYVGNGGDFRRAEEEGVFPVRWLWPDQVGNLAISNSDLLAAARTVIAHVGQMSLNTTGANDAVAALRAAVANAEGRANG